MQDIYLSKLDFVRFPIFLTAEKIRYDFAYFLHTGFTPSLDVHQAST